MTYLRGFGSRVATPQSQPIRNVDQVKNAAGGYVYAIDKWQQAERFILLGTEGGTYYVDQHTFTAKNVTCLEECVRTDGLRLVSLARDISVSGRAAKNDPALFALAVAISLGDVATRQAAAEAVLSVARTGTHIVHFYAYALQMRGHGHVLNRAIQNWFLVRRPKALLFQAIKYQSRDGWALRDLLRLARPKALNDETNLVLRYIVKGDVSDSDLFEQVRAIKLLADPNIALDDAVNLIQHYRIPRESVPTSLLKHAAVWRALIQDMPLNALLRNLRAMTVNGAIYGGDLETTEFIVSRLIDSERIHHARVHPLQYLTVANVYASGYSTIGRGRGAHSVAWTPVQDIVDALNVGFYRSFPEVTPIGKRVLLAVDVSGSMGSGEIAGLPGVTPRVAAAALAMQYKRTEPHAYVMGFQGPVRAGSFFLSDMPQEQSIEGFVPLNISPTMRLDTVVNTIRQLPFGPTDCAVPFLWASQKHLPFDLVQILTDSESWAGKIHTSQALEEYRHTSPGCRMVAVAFTATDYSVADPNDVLSMNVVGFDPAAQNVIAAFAGSTPTVIDDDNEDAEAV